MPPPNEKTLQTLKQYVQPGLPLERILEIKSAYDLFDLHGKNQVAPRDLQTCLINLGLNAKKPTLHSMLTELEEFVRESRSVTLDDFIKIVTTSRIQPSTSDDIRRIFRLFDPEGTGFISSAKLKEICDEIGENLRPEEINEMIRRADRDRDGVVNFKRHMTELILAVINNMLQI